MRNKIAINMNFNINELNNIIKEEYNHYNYLSWKRKNVTLRGISNRIGEENGGGALLGDGLYTAFLSNKSMAKSYGKVYFVLNAIPKKPKIFQYLNGAEIFIQYIIINFNKQYGEDYNRSFFEKHTSIRDEVLKLGYDGIIIKGREMVNYNPPDNVMYFENENQLMNYYETHY